MRRMHALALIILLSSLQVKAAEADTSKAPGDSLVLQNVPGALDTTSLSFKDTDLRDIVRALSYQHGVNVLLDNSVNKKITVALKRVRVFDAIKILAEENGLLLKVEGGIFKLLPTPAPPLPPPRIPSVGFESGLLTVSLKDDDLESVVSEIQKKSGKNILIISGTTGTVSGTLRSIDFDIGFTQLMNNSGFAVQKKSGIYIVSRLDYFVGTQGAQSQQKSGPYWVSVKDSLVTVDVTSAPLERLLHDMIRQLSTDVVFYNQVQGTVTARATNVTLSTALEFILRNTAYGYQESDGVYFIGEKTNKALAATRLLRLRYLTADQTLELIPQSITTQATIKVIKEQNGFVVTGPLDVIAQMKEFLSQIDKPVAQVLIEAIVVDYDLTKGLQLGVEAGVSGKTDTTAYGRSGSFIPGIQLDMSGSYLNRKFKQMGTQSILGTDFNFAKLGKLPVDFYLNLKAMETKGLANIKSRPILATLNGHKATLSIGTTQYFLLNTTIPYRDQTQVLMQTSQSFQTIEANVKLEITPFVGSDGLITVEVKPDFRTPVGEFTSSVPPTINQRALSSTLVVKEGETIVLGGLVQETQSEDRSQVPLLGSIPLLGNLFASTSTTSHKSELIIYITPHISYGETFRGAFAPPTEE